MFTTNVFLKFRADKLYKPFPQHTHHTANKTINSDFNCCFYLNPAVYYGCARESEAGEPAEDVIPFTHLLQNSILHWGTGLWKTNFYTIYIDILDFQ